MSDSFLGRWSRRKHDARDGRPLPGDPPQEAAQQSMPVAAVPSIAAAPDAAVAQPMALAAEMPARAADEPPPPPTMEDVQALTAQSDFSRFAARDVAADVKNAALKKLFTDPHYNVMDGLDTYIADYNTPDPLPASMLRKMAQSAFLGLFREDDENPDLQLQPDHAAGRPGAGEGDGAPGDGRRGDGDAA